MAKLKMKCPFSNNLCRNCSFYIGRHYFLCYKPEYRGHINNPGNKKDKANGFLNNVVEFKVPVISTKSFDPFNMDQNDAV
jgi:hypothetical protein